MTFIAQLSQDNGNITLNKFDGTSFPRFNPNHTGSDIVKVCFLDLETTGLDKIDDKIIELALKLVAIDRNNGELLGVIAEYQSFHDPNELIDEKIMLYSPGNSFKPTKIYQEKDVYDKWGVNVKQFIDYLSLLRDASDNIPGVKGVGSKTASKLIDKFD